MFNLSKARTRKKRFDAKRLAVFFVFSIATNDCHVWACKFADMARDANCYFSITGSGYDVQFTISQNNVQKVSQNLSSTSFKNFSENRQEYGDFSLFKKDNRIFCEYRKGAPENAHETLYAFSFDIHGNIDISAALESAPGFSNKYAFKTNGSIASNNPVSFYSLATDSREFRNLSVLKMKDFYHKFSYFYNGGVIDSKSNHSSNGDLEAYKKTELFPEKVLPPSFKSNTYDNCGLEIGGFIQYSAGVVTVNSYGTTIGDSIDFQTEGSSLNIEGTFLVDTISGKVITMNVGKPLENKKAPIVNIDSFKVQMFDTFSNKGILLIGNTTQITTKTLYNSGEICARESLTASYTSLAGGGAIVVGGTYTAVNKGIQKEVMNLVASNDYFGSSGTPAYRLLDSLDDLEEELERRKIDKLTALVYR